MELYKKYRPESLDQVRGNSGTVDSLRAIPEGKIPHAIMFTGPSGCGKTTLARIMARRLKCKGSDFREIDSAHFGGKEMVREIRRQMSYKPLEGPCRVWLLDESHELSTQAQDALLKALEDTPKHVYFLFGTTEPQKLLNTLRNRCTQYTVESLTEKQIVKLLQGVCRAERKKTPSEVLQQIARDSLGSARAALVILGKIIDLDREKMLAAAKQSAIEENEVIELCRTLLKGGSWKKVCSILKGLEQEPESTRRAVLGYCASVLLNGDNPRAFLIVDLFSKNLFDSGRAGLVAACYEIIQEKP